MPRRQCVNCDTLKTTLAIIKPEAMQYEKRILQNFIKNGYHIIQRKKFQLSPELAADFYKEYEKCKIYMILVLNLSNGPIEAIILAKVNAIYDLLDLVGPVRPSEARQCFPNSLRSIFGDCQDDYKNAIHASTDSKNARREISFFFPNFVVEPIQTEMSKQLCCIRRDIIEKLIEGLFDITKTKPDELKTWLANWFIENNSNRPIIYTENIQPICKPIQDTAPVCDHKRLMNDICKNVVRQNDISSSSYNNDGNDKVDLEKLLCCCNAGIQPTEIVNCPICDKIIIYSPPCGQGAKKKIQYSSESTTSSLSSSSSALSSCKCAEDNEFRKSTSSSVSCKCCNENENENITSTSTSTNTSSDASDACDCAKTGIFKNNNNKII